MSELKETLAKELALERFNADRDYAMEGGYDFDLNHTIESYYKDALEFVERCRNSK